MSEQFKFEPAKYAHNLTEALRIHDETQRRVRAVLVGEESPPLQQPTTEVPPVTEKNPKSFEKIIFGHDFKDFDRDQLITYFLAYKIGLIDAETPAAFTLEPTANDFSNPATLVIESYVTPDNLTKASRQGNFLTGTNDEPAAALFHHYYSRDIQKLPNAAALNELVAWLKSVDTKTALTKPLQVFNPEVLATVTRAFYGLKLSYPEPATLLKESVALLELALQHPQDVISLQTKYEQPLQAITEKRRQDFLKLQERARDPRYLKTATTLTGKKLAYFDIRGLNVEAGGLKIAQQRTNADVVFLIDEETAGTRFIIRTDSDNLTDRLQMSENLFGKGFKIKLQYGGHPGIILSPPGYGSGLNPEKVWIALQKHFNAPRYSGEAFKKKGIEFAHQLGIEKALQFSLPPSDEYSFAEWQLQLNLSQPGQTTKIVTLSESDLALYESALTGQPTTDLHLLQQKTVISESPLITDRRLSRAQTSLDQFIGRKEATQILLCLDDLNKTSIQQLPFAQQLKILESVAQDPLSIDQVWNKDNLLFRITHPIPDWIAKDLDTYKAERFKYDSVPQKIDTTLVESVLSKLEAVAEPSQWAQLVTALVTIITSDAYKHSHRDKSFDRLLEHCLKACLSATMPAVHAVAAVTTLSEKYGADMLAHWQALPATLIRNIQEKFPQAFTFLPASVGEVAPTKDTSFLSIVEPNPETIDPAQPIQTIFVEIGRPIAADIKSKGIHGLNSAGESIHYQDITFTSEIRATNQSLQLDKDHADHEVIAQEIVKHVLSISARAPDSKIRIIGGSFMNILTRKVITLIPHHLWDKVFFCDYNAHTNQYTDDQVLSPSEPSKKATG